MSFGTLYIIIKIIGIVIMVGLVFSVLRILLPFLMVGLQLVVLLCKQIIKMIEYKLKFSKTENDNGTVLIRVSPKKLHVSITDAKKDFYILRLDGEISERVKIIFEVDNLDMIKTGKIKIVLNGDENNAIVYDMKDLPVKVNEPDPNENPRESKSPDPNDDLINGYGVGSNFYYNNIAADEEWFFETYYRK